MSDQSQAGTEGSTPEQTSSGTENVGAQINDAVNNPGTDQETTDTRTSEPSTPSDDFPKAGRDAELEAQRQAELDAQRDEHNRRSAPGGGTL